LARVVQPWSLEDFERLLQDQNLTLEVMRTLAAALRAQHGTQWLLRFNTPDGLDAKDEAAIVRAVRGVLTSRAGLPDWDELAPAAAEWVTRLIRSRSEVWDRLGELVDRAATVAARRLGGGVQGELFSRPEHRAVVAAEVARSLPAYLGPLGDPTVTAEAERLALAEGLVREHLGAGALEEFLQDSELTEIMLGAGGRIWVERSGRLEETGQRVPEKRALWFAQRLAALIGSRVDLSEPELDGFLPDGSRVHVLIPPIAVDGVSITIRRHARRPTLEQLLSWGALSEEAAAFLQDAVRGRANILVSGGTSSGKTSLLNVLAGFIPPAERVITMEDTPELRLPLSHVIRLRTRRANIEGRGEFTMRQLVRASLRMRPDRIVVGEVRGAEALDMIEALNTGHDGGLATAHANGPADMLKRLSQMMKRGDGTLTDSGAYELIASAIHLIVHAERRVVGDRVVRGVEEVVELEDYQSDRPGVLGFKLRTIFRRASPGGPLERVGGISERLAAHLQANGVDVARWRG